MKRINKPMNKTLTKSDEKILLPNRNANKVIIVIKDFDGNKVSVMSMKYDGSAEGAVKVAAILQAEAFLKYQRASNMESTIGTTDENGDPKWIISPNLRHVAEVKTKEARNIAGDINLKQ